jgi:hypothetical protein
MPNCDSRGSSRGPHRPARKLGRRTENPVPEEDLIMEQILNNITTTPIGQVLKKIASLPEVRQEKILNLRRQLTEGKYNLNERLDVVLDKVLEELTAQTNSPLPKCFLRPQ